MNDQVNSFHNFINDNCKNYVCIIAIGSIATGDCLIPGRSDSDFLLIFDNPLESDFTLVKSYLDKGLFDDTYNFVIFNKEDFLKNRNHSHDFSGKFRSKVIFGEDILPLKELPEREAAFKIYTQGLLDVKTRLARVIFNSGGYSDQKVRDVLWKQFKHAFMYLAIKVFLDSGLYPKTRNDIVKFLDSNTLELTLDSLINIDNKEKKELIFVAEELLIYLNSLQQ